MIKDAMTSDQAVKDGTVVDALAHDHLTTEAKPTDEAYAKLKQQAHDYLDGWKRAKADYLNLKKQSEREKEELVGFATAALILDLLPIKTNFDRAWQHLPKELTEQEWVKGINQIHSQFDALLKTLGIEAIDPVGQPFDPEKHEAIERKDDQTVPDGHVISTLEPGYSLRGNVITPAKVTVSTHAAQDHTKGGE